MSVSDTLEKITAQIEHLSRAKGSFEDMLSKGQGWGCDQLKRSKIDLLIDDLVDQARQLSDRQRTEWGLRWSVNDQENDKDSSESE